MRSTIPISEIFGPVIQGEGALIGRPTVFVRTGGCDFRCSWCDTLYAVLPEHRNEWQAMDARAIVDEVLRLSGGHPILVTLSGGNPALQPLEPLLEMGHARGLSFALETQGSVARAWFAQLDHLILSPKPPSSRMKTDWDKLAACIAAAGPQTKTVLKIVVFDEADYRYAREAGARFPGVPMVLQVGNPAPPQRLAADEPDADKNQNGDAPTPAQTAARLEWLLGCVTRDGWNEVTILPQLHVLLWGNKRGV
jgi:7-carboxy-7-deazaguanine synthase